MPKKSSSKVSTITKEESDARQEKTLPKSKKADEIDDIFLSKKRKKPEIEKDDKPGETKDKPKTKKKKSKDPRESQVQLDSKPRRRTNDGLAIYSEEDLRINSQNAGGTRLCPFDCSCCF